MEDNLFKDVLKNLSKKWDDNMKNIFEGNEMIAETIWVKKNGRNFVLSYIFKKSLQEMS